MRKARTKRPHPHPRLKGLDERDVDRLLFALSDSQFARRFSLPIDEVRTLRADRLSKYATGQTPINPAHDI